ISCPISPGLYSCLRSRRAIYVGRCPIVRGDPLATLDSNPVRIAHSRERNAPAGSPRRLAAARDVGAGHWLDLEDARQGLVVEDPRRAHNSALFRQPITTLDDHLARGLRVEALGGD